MIALRRSNFTKNIRAALILLLLGAALFLINLAGFGKEIKNAFFTASFPVQSFFWKQGEKVNFVFQTLGEIKTLKEKNEKLEEENRNMAAQIVGLKELEKENQTLRQALNLGLEKEFGLSMAQTFAKDPFQDSILINKGEADGIKREMAVITQQKILVGRIEETFKNYSRVALISNKKLAFDARIEDSNPEILGVIKGQRNFRARFDLIPQEKPVQIGQKLITTSLGGIFPKGLIAGEIIEINYSDVKPFQTATVKPAVQIKDLSTVFIIKNF